MMAGSAKVFFLFCQFPKSCATHIFLSNLCPTHNSQPYECPTLCIAMRAYQPNITCWDVVFLLLGDLSVLVFPNIGENAQSSFNSRNFLVLNIFFNSIQSYYNSFVLKLTNKHKEHRQGWFIPNNRISSTAHRVPAWLPLASGLGNLTSARTPLPNDRTAEELFRFVVSEVLPDI